MRVEDQDTLVQKLKEAKEELFNLRFQAATAAPGTSPRPRSVRTRPSPPHSPRPPHGPATTAGTPTPPPPWSEPPASPPTP
ncbi:50S ribosomal protein L29 [Nonomuraea sp. NPDC050643]|uniref:50S ribosomal protein L29 n=1 Tax=Nonomuraea sp. NPDC050643 TaxID=3155660 RepID=UPI0033F4CE8C